jgi:hypothetical protein
VCFSHTFRQLKVNPYRAVCLQNKLAGMVVYVFRNTVNFANQNARDGLQSILLMVMTYRRYQIDHVGYGIKSLTLS